MTNVTTYTGNKLVCTISDDGDLQIDKEASDKACLLDHLDALERLFNYIEKEAFEIFAPNQHTPAIVEHCIVGKDVLNRTRKLLP